MGLSLLWQSFNGNHVKGGLSGAEPSQLVGNPGLVAPNGERPL